MDQVRQLIRTPLRGELSGPLAAVTNAGIPLVDSVADLLSQVLRISSTPSRASHHSPPSSAALTSPPIAPVPPITITNDHLTSAQSGGTATAAPWSLTASGAASTQSALLPFLIHLAAARDDVDGIRFCIDLDDQLFNAIANPGGVGGIGDVTSSGSAGTMTVPGGVVNCVDASTKMSPLHIAALNGNERAADLLLQNGALVHQRDVLDHTPLYYVSARAEGSSSSVDLPVYSVGCSPGSPNHRAEARQSWGPSQWIRRRPRLHRNRDPKS